MADNSQEIADLEEVLSSGVQRTTTDNTTTWFQNPSDLRKQLDKLKDDDDSGNYKKRRRSTLKITLW